MLTLDLLRYRINDENITPIYLTATGGKRYIGLAESLLAIHRNSIGGRVGDLEEAVEELAGTASDYKVHRGLAKVLWSYVTAEPLSDMDVEELRRVVFTLAADGGVPVRKPDLLFTRTAADKAREIAEKTGVSPDHLDELLYCDLKENHIIRAFDGTITPEQLIQRYNTALAQAMLFRATRMVIDVYDSYRIVFKYIKLARLMHSITPHRGGYRIRIDGPASLFSQVERYGIAMAKVLPAVLKCSKWQLAAKVNFGGGEKIFRLYPKEGLTSHYRDEPVFDSSPEEAFFTKFSRNKKSKWTIEREGSVLDLNETVMIPDFKFTHADGRVVHLEIVGFWTPDYLEKKLDKLSRVRESNIVVAVPESLNCSRDDFSGPVVRYKGRLLIKDVLPALEAASADQVQADPCCLPDV